MNEPPETIVKSLQAVICTRGWDKEKLALLKGLKLADVRGIFEEMYHLYYFSCFAFILYTHALMYSLNYCLVSNTAHIQTAFGDYAQDLGEH